MAPVCVILSLGIWSSISGPASVVPLGVGACSCFSKSNEKLFCEMMKPPWWILDGLWWLLVSFPLFSKDLRDFVGFLGAAGPWVGLILVLSFCQCFAGVLRDHCLPHLPIKLRARLTVCVVPWATQDRKLLKLLANKPRNHVYVLVTCSSTLVKKSIPTSFVRVMAEPTF